MDQETTRADAGCRTRLAVENAWLDGELVALNRDGTMSFQALQNAFDHRHDGRLIYYVFDLLFLNGTDLRSRPLYERKRQLAALLDELPEAVRCDTATMFSSMAA